MRQQPEQNGYKKMNLKQVEREMVTLLRRYCELKKIRLPATQNGKDYYFNLLISTTPTLTCSFNLNQD
ncbi:hypothetical protein QOT17_001678 [Balamuthia mandrillaris]